MLEYVECDHCTLIFQRYVAATELRDAMYDDSLSDAWAAFEHDRPIVANAHALARNSSELLRVLVHLGRDPAEVSIYDFGMGWGVLGRIATAYGCRAYGTDISSAKCAVAAATDTSLLTIDEAAVRGMEFDFVNVDQVLEHVAKPREIVESLVHLVRADGLIKLSVPNATNHRWRLRSFTRERADTGGPLNAYAPLEHVNSFSGRALRTMARAAGLECRRSS